MNSGSSINHDTKMAALLSTQEKLAMSVEVQNKNNTVVLNPVT